MVVSVFIAQIHPEFRPDPDVLWQTGPSRTAVRAQAILFASLSISIFAALLAMLGKELWSRYTFVDTRWSIIKRSQNRQWKLDSDAYWYIYRAIRLPTSMLHIAALLLGCGLSLYLWEVNTAAALVVIAATSFGVLSYLFISSVSGSVSVDDSYQPISRRITKNPDPPLSVFSTFVEISACRHLLSMVKDELTKEPPKDIVQYLFHRPDKASALLCVFLLPVYFLVDAYRLCLVVDASFESNTQRVNSWFSKQQEAVLDLRCISWTLETSLNARVRISALNFLAVTTLTRFDPTLFVKCFDVFVGCINVSNGKVTVIHELDHVATLAALCCLHTLSPLAKVDTTVEEIRRRYVEVFPPETDFGGLPFTHTLGAVHSIFYQTEKLHVVFPTCLDQITLITWRSKNARRVQWKNYKPPVDQHIATAHALAKLARFEYGRRGRQKVPRWLLLFAFHSLAQDPLPPTSVVINCLSIIAIDMGCRVPDTTVSNENERYASL